MPIYEFYCEKCHTIFNFFSRTVNVKKEPVCPECEGPLQRQVSMFSCLSKTKDMKGPEDLPIDEAKLEKAMSRLTADAERLNEEDPRQAADLMRKFSEMTGVHLGDGMQEALRRVEAGEDPETIEAEMGDILENEDPFSLEGGGKRQKSKTPRRDETLYEL